MISYSGIIYRVISPLPFCLIGGLILFWSGIKKYKNRFTKKERKRIAKDPTYATKVKRPVFGIYVDIGIAILMVLFAICNTFYWGYRMFASEIVSKKCVCVENYRDAWGVHKFSLNYEYVFTSIPERMQQEYYYFYLDAISASKIIDTELVSGETYEVYYVEGTDIIVAIHESDLP